MNKIGTRLKAIRKNAGYKQWQISEKLGLAKHSYGSYENDNSIPSISKFIVLAEIFQTTVQFIIIGKEFPADNWSEKVTPFSERLKELRIQNGFTQKEIAKELGVHFSNYQKYENATCEPKLESLIKLADLFDVTLDELMGRNRK